MPSVSSAPSFVRLANITANTLSFPNPDTMPSVLSSEPCAAISSAQQFDHFSGVTVAPPDEIFNTGARYRADPSPSKVDLGAGAYRTDEGKPLVLNAVRKAEKLISNDPSLNKEYLGIEGDLKLIKVASELLFGVDSPALIGNRVASCQGISGTGSVRVGLDFVKHFLPAGTTILISKPTWGNHITMFNMAGLPYKWYRYWDNKARNLDFSGMLEDLRAAPNRSVVLLHACAHNPTGMDPTKDQWAQIAQVMREKQHLPFFDSAYQGFASGDLEADAYSIRFFVKQGFQLIAAQSFAKNFGLYNERVGTVNIVCANSQQKQAVFSQMKMLIRPNYSNPPAHGARIVSTILTRPELYEEWRVELRGMAERIKSMRSTLRSELERLHTPGDWSHITTQIGMFSFTGLTSKQCAAMCDKWHVYMLSNGRISMAGLNSKNVQYVAKAMNDVVSTIRE